MAYKLSATSKKKLKGVKPELVKVVERAIEITKIDFTVGEGVRSLKRQKMLKRTGKSQTLRSKHITGDAVDLFAYVNGKVSWDIKLYDNIADAMRQAALEKGVKLRWGAAWNIPDIRSWKGPMQGAMDHYAKARRSKGRRPFIDGVHFELN